MTKQVYINIKELVQVRPPSLTPLTGIEFQNVPSIPNAFLVNGAGEIVASGQDLRGLNLHITLDKYLK